ncbi:hypothetical protein [Frigoriglobus tundricola]|nr:hypothetical protein [Frigoriglobus tundricola]
MLRTSVGEYGVSPVVQLQAMLQRGELPGERACACCGRNTDHLIPVSVVCERVINAGPSGGANTDLAGCLFFGIAWLIMRSSQKPVQHGTDVSFVLPVRVCGACDHTLAAPKELRAALGATPAYAAVFDQYPNALVRRVS